MSEKKRFMIGTLILAAAVLLIAAGMKNGEAATVFTKATKICLECIGIG